MKKNDRSWINDVHSLVSQSVLAEASEKVWEKFEGAMSQLDPASQALLRQFFDGVGVEELGKRHGLSEAQVGTWLGKARGQLIENLRTSFRVRQ